jgi:RNA 2',3'-cyclic 3'-phosphodiesterase
LPNGTRTSIVRWQSRVFADPAGVRPVAKSNLHVTIAFLGATSADRVEAVVAAVREAARGMRTPTLTAARYHETRSVGMLVLDDADRRASELAERVFERLERLGVYERERRAWLPHVTVARFRERPRLSLPVPDLGRVSPSEVALYHSVLRPAGAQYEVVESVALGGSHVGA